MIGPNTEGKENDDDILSSELFTKHLLGLFEAETVFLEAAEILSQEKVQENVSHLEAYFPANVSASPLKPSQTLSHRPQEVAQAFSFCDHPRAQNWLAEHHQPPPGLCASHCMIRPE